MTSFFNSYYGSYPPGHKLFPGFTESLRSEESLVENLKQLQRRLVDDGPRAAGVEESHVDDGRVVVAGILPGKIDSLI